MADTRADRSSGARCPICGKPREAAWRPFCSRRCADVDLARWLKGAYAIPSPEAPDEDGRDSEDDGHGGA